jgi:hypothetical protein
MVGLRVRLGVEVTHQGNAAKISDKLLSATTDLSHGTAKPFALRSPR